jgi:hypothetical protein
VSATDHPPAGPAANGTPGLLIHTAGPLDREALLGVLRTAANARAGLTPWDRETPPLHVVKAPHVHSRQQRKTAS